MPYVAAERPRQAQYAIGRHNVNLFLTIKIQSRIALIRASCLPSKVITTLSWRVLFHRSSLGDGLMPVGARWSDGMSRREVQADENLLAAFALTIGGALGAGLPMALLIIWVCS